MMILIYLKSGIVNMTREEIYSACETALTKSNVLLLEAATGLGKSKISIDLVNWISNAVYKDHKPKMLLLVAKKVHKQTWKDEFQKWGGINADVTMECYESLHKHTSESFDFILMDECHHAGSELRIEALKTIQYGYMIGLSATIPLKLKQWFKYQYHAQIVSCDIIEAIDSEVLPEPTILLFPLQLENTRLSETVELNPKAKGPVVYGLMRFLMQVSYIIKKITGKNPGRHMFKAVLKQANIYTIRIAICGGGPLAPSVFKIFNELGINFVQGYGLTETSPILTLNPIEHFKIQSVGQMFTKNEEIKILNPNEDGIGEICVKGSMVMQGYYNMEEETKAVFTEDGWFKTGDLGWLDDENYLMLSGRAKNMIVTEGGKNVYPEEIEDAFQLEYDIEQITIQGYIANAETKSEELEALVYASDDLYKKLNLTREDKASEKNIYAEIEKIVTKINKTLLPYQRITKITLLEKPLEMTTTKKVKRNYKK